jgi:ubiquinone/menaquinone biosynthesis C-methylase UbiE
MSSSLHTGSHAPAGPGNPVSRWLHVVLAAGMAVGRGRAARTVAQLTGPSPGDRVVDVGCGPGTAVREAASRGAAATGVDPQPAMLTVARWISARRQTGRVSWLPGSAEALPLPDAAATLVWSISSCHHWRDIRAGLREARRVLAPGGRLLIAERLLRKDGHGFTQSQADTLARQAADEGFTEVRTAAGRAGRRTLVIVQAVRGAGT